MRFSIGLDAQGMHCPDLQVWDDVIGRRRDTNEGKGQWRNPEKPASRRLDKRIADLQGQSQLYQQHMFTASIAGSVHHCIPNNTPSPNPKFIIPPKISPSIF